MSEKLAVIIRGLPGTGKTQFSTQLKHDAEAAGFTVEIHSTNITQNGVPIPRNHHCTRKNARKQTFASFCNSIDKGINLVIYEGCNVRHSHFIRFIDYARTAGYIVEVHEMPMTSIQDALARCKAHIPLETIERMMRTWEPY